MELVLGVLCFVLVTAYTRLYLRYLHVAAVRDREFEAWVRSQPVVAAFECAPDQVHDVADALRHLVGARRFANLAGGYPWQHYVLTVDERRLGPTTLGIVLTACRMGRPNSAPPDISLLPTALAQRCRGALRDVWLHGQLHGTDPKIDRRRVSWHGLVSGGSLELTPMIGDWPGPARGAGNCATQ